MIAVGKGIKSAVIAAGIMVVLGACTSQYRNHGYVPTEEDLAEITVGVDTRDTVAETVGTPSASGVLDSSGYYYVRSRVRHYGARKPEVVERRIVAITFDNRGVVRNVEEYALEDGQAVPIARRITDNDLNNQSILGQLLKNIGSFGGFSS
ncbi:MULTISPECIES: outer membrane protein assembly factor BamE [Shimia]|uniref:outer membrane protein assembly factor BamE n=1 Tax=Shimia TaxID=573139 RepID=UPI001FB3CF8E|nr:MULTISPECIES: outer membrane protein assembly factor BamE [Shimia]MDV4144057.1 outer membrane protein assembly factor BamE [Shimia sp. FJ5]